MRWTAAAGGTNRWAATLAALVLALAGCVTAPARGPGLAACEARFERVDERLRAAGLIDAQAYRVPGFPYLRSDRLLASFADEVTGEAAFTAWVARLRDLARRGRAIELALLYPGPGQARPVADALAECAKRLQAADLGSAPRRALLRERAQVPDDYRDGARIAGLYPLAVPFLKIGVAAWRARVHAAFAAPPADATLRRYAPAPAHIPSADRVAAWLAAARRRAPLSIPELDAERLWRVARRHAPVFAIDTAARYDRPGTPYRDAGGPDVDTGRLQVYVQPGYTRFEDRVLLQLSYLIWFSRRPAAGWIDLLAGAIDGLVWRVTLDADGRPLLYDSIHPCGCYHMFFPTESLRRGLGDGFWDEGALVPATAPKAVPVRVQVASRTHYIDGLHAAQEAPADAVRYRLVDYDALRQQRPRLFGNNGLMAGSQRSERWLLWPSGVVSAGAMRQWGHHATAFVGERHFDDPRLIGRYFERVR